MKNWKLKDTHIHICFAFLLVTQMVESELFWAPAQFSSQDLVKGKISVIAQEKSSYAVFLTLTVQCMICFVYKNTHEIDLYSIKIIMVQPSIEDESTCCTAVVDFLYQVDSEEKER